MQKPVLIKIDTKNSEAVIIANNIRKGDTLLVTFKIFQDSMALNLTGQSMHVVLQKSDGFGVEKIINSVTGNTFQVAFSVQATLAVGDVVGIVEISDSNGTNITNTFTFEVKENPSSNIVTQSKNEIETLSQIIAIINSYNADADNLKNINNVAIQTKNQLVSLNTTSLTLANRLESDNLTGTATAVRIENDISVANSADNALKQEIINSNNAKNNLVSTINSGTVLNDSLGNKLVNSTEILQQLDVIIGGETITDDLGNPITDDLGSNITDSPHEGILKDAQATAANLNNHINDSVRHITQDERNELKKNTSDIATANNNIANNYNSLNSSISNVNNNFNNHKNDNVRHTTEDERNKWNYYEEQLKSAYNLIDILMVGMPITDDLNDPIKDDLGNIITT